MRPNLHDLALKQEILRFFAEFEVDHSETSEREYVDLREHGFHDVDPGILDFNLRQAQNVASKVWARVPKDRNCIVIFEPAFRGR